MLVKYRAADKVRKINFIRHYLCYFFTGSCVRPLVDETILAGGRAFGFGGEMDGNYRNKKYASSLEP